MDTIYLDYNATTPVAAEVALAMAPCLDAIYGNPSSHHSPGVAAKNAVDAARTKVAALFNCRTSEVVFTSGGTEANNSSIKGMLFGASNRNSPFHVITSEIEHPSVLGPCRFIESLGAQVTRLPVDRFGMVDPEDVRRAILPHTKLVSIMHANNEVGTIQPIRAIADVTHANGALMHTDAAQTVGKVSVDVQSLGVDLLSIAGHKFYGPKGVGALFLRSGVTLEPLLHGAGHEMGRRAGTENLLEIVGLGTACELAQAWENAPSIVQLRDRFWEQLQSAFGQQVVLNGHPEKRLPNTLNVSFVGHNGQDLLAKMPHVAASTGSACHAGSTHMSPVLAAMQVPNAVGAGAIRFSLGRHTTIEEIDNVIRSLRSLIL